MSLKFPKDFYWGAATSSHQIEGNTHNDWSEWEQSLKRRQELINQGKDPAKFISGRNSDSYANNNANIVCLLDLGANAYRWSLEWSRIEPRPGDFQEDVLEHYKDFCKKLRAHGIEPVVTIWHWTNPVWLRDVGDWSSPRVVKYFARFVKKVAEYLDEEVNIWITINEPLVFSSFSYLHGSWPPQRQNWFAYMRVLRHLRQAHIQAYKILKKINSYNQIGIASHNIYFEAHNNLFFNRFIKKLADWWWNDRFLKQIDAHQDFIGLNYYFHSLVNFLPGTATYYERYSDMGWGLYPEGIYHVLKDLKKYSKPIYITEAGLADKSDTHRRWYLQELLKNIHKAMLVGVDVRGFFYWSLIDNFEWANGYDPCFGLYEVNYQTLERISRSSAKFYRDIIQTNQLLLDDE